MKRRQLIIQTITATVSAGVFTATGWLMGGRALTMPPAPSPWPCPPDPGTCGSDCGGIFTGCVIFTSGECVGSGCNKLCMYKCVSGSGISEYWYGCTSENPPCSYGFCIYSRSEGGQCILP